MVNGISTRAGILAARLTRKHSSFLLAKAQTREEKQALYKEQEKAQAILEAQQIVQQIAETVQAKAHKRIADVVTRCLAAVFEDDAYTFKIQFARKRGKTEARLLFVRDGMEIDPVDAAGGGTIDVAAFALRLACLMLSQPRRRRLLLLDEPFKFLSKEYRPKVRAMIEMLSKEMGVQICLVTHSPEFVIGKVIEIT